MNKLNRIRQVQIISALVEGNSLRATARMCDVAFNTVLKLLPQIGEDCAAYQNKSLRNLPCKRIQCDEIWSFVGAKEKNASEEKKAEGWGDVWTWVVPIRDLLDVEWVESQLKQMGCSEEEIKVFISSCQN